MKTGLLIQFILAATLYMITGLFVFSRLRGSRNRWPYSLWIMTSVFWFSVSTGFFLNARPETATLCARISYTAIVFIPIMMLHFCSAFLENPASTRIIIAGYILAAFFAATIWIDGLFIRGVWSYPWGFYAKCGILQPLFMGTCAATIFYFFWQTNRKLREPGLSHIKREQVIWIRRGLLWYAAGCFDFLMNWGLPLYPMAQVFSVIGLLHIAYAIVRLHLLDIHVIIRRTLVYSIASTILTSFYVGVLFGTLELLRPLFKGNAMGSVIVACFVAALCHPLVRRIQRPIDQMLGRNRLDQGIELMKFSTELGQNQSLERTRSLLGHIIEQAFHPARFVIYWRSAKGHRLLLQHGIPSSPPLLTPEDRWVKRFEEHVADHDVSGMTLSAEYFPDASTPVCAAVPMVNQMRLQGFILLGEKISEDLYTEQDMILLRIIANQAAVVLERPHLIKEVGSGFAHEIKTPLTKIAMPAELLVLEMQDLLNRDDQDIREFLSLAVPRLERIVDLALFACGRVDAMQQLTEAASTARYARIALADAVGSAARLLQGLAEESGVELAIQVSEPLAVIGDEQQIEILVSNLIKNAIEAATGSMESEVVVRGLRQNDRIGIEVEDTGPGIHPGEEDKVYEPYFSTKPGNTRGMGLYIARRIAHAHQGTLSYERRGQRTAMRIVFPAVDTKISYSTPDATLKR